MTPSHGDLTDPQPAPLGQEQNLRIEAKAVDGLCLEEPTRPIPAKQLEPALRVVKLQPETDAHQTVEQNSTGLAKSGLVPLNITSIEGARPDDDIGNIPLCDVVELEQFVDRSREGSASVKRTYVPVALSMPVRTLCPLPRRSSWWMSRTPSRSKRLTIVPVPSVEPSSTTRISKDRGVLPRNSRSLASESAIRRDSLNAGMTIEIVGGGVSPAGAAAGVPESGRASSVRSSELEVDPVRPAGVISNGCAAETSTDLMPCRGSAVFECLHGQPPAAVDRRDRIPSARRRVVYGDAHGGRSAFSASRKSMYLNWVAPSNSKPLIGWASSGSGASPLCTTRSPSGQRGLIEMSSCCSRKQARLEVALEHCRVARTVESRHA